MKTLKGIVIQRNMIQMETGELIKFNDDTLEIGDHVTVSVDYTSKKVTSIDTEID
jgi:hypothetical protein